VLYGEIIDALERGYFGRLRRCRECPKFFVAEDPRQKFCTPACMLTADKKAARERVKEWRESKNKKLLRQAQDAAECKGFKRFCEFGTVTVRGEVTQKEDLRLLKTLGKGRSFNGWKVIKEWQEKQKAGMSLRDIWEGLTKERRQGFEAESRSDA
jgi:hypothetical protein